MFDAFRFTVRGINRLFTMVAGALALAIMVVIMQDVVRRSLFNDPSTWALDVSSFLLCYLFFLALGPALQEGAHVSVDLVERMLTSRLRRWMAIVAALFVVAFAVVLLWKVMESVIDVFETGELFPTATPMPVKYVWIVGPIGVVQFLLTALVAIFEPVGLAARRDEG